MSTSRYGRRRKYYIGAVIVVGVLLLYGMSMVTLRYKDKKSFESAEKKVLVLADKIQALGTVGGHTERYYCYQTEQGPFDHGRLWCSVESTFEERLADYTQATQVAKSAYDIVARSYGNGVTFSALGTSEERGELRNKSGFSDNGKTCGVDVDYSTQSGHMTISVSCSSRAMSKYYEYTP